MIILMSGSTGFIGKRLKIELLKKGHTIFSLKRVDHKQDDTHLAETDISLRHINNLEKIFKKRNLFFDCIIHLATSYGKDSETRSEINEVNYNLPKRMFEIALKNKVKMFINFDTSLPDDTNFYSTTKANFRNFVKENCEVNKLRFFNLRLQNVLGVDTRIKSFPYQLVKACFLNDDIFEITPGEQIRDFIHINDVLDCLLFLIAVRDTFEDGFNDFDLGSGKGVSIKAFATLVKKLSSSRTKLLFGAKKYQTNEPFTNIANPNKLRALGWVSKIELSEAIGMMLQELQEKIKIQ